jgi:hypothetical protein
MKNGRIRVLESVEVKRTRNDKQSPPNKKKYGKCYFR